MPNRTINRKNAQRTGKSLVPGKNKPAKGRQSSGGAGQENPRVIANSVFALTLQPKVALQVMHNMTEKLKSNSDNENYFLMYEQLLVIIQRAVKLATDETTTFNPYVNGFDLSQSFAFIFKILISNVLPSGWSFNVEAEHNYSRRFFDEKKQDPAYHLVMYKECDFQIFWHCFEIKPVVEYYYKKNIQLHDMFIRFMANFCRHTGIMTWYQGGLGYIDGYFLLENIENYEWDSDEDRANALAEVTDVIELYQYGDAHWYEEFIKAQPLVSPEQLRIEINQFPRKNNLLNWMLAACDLMEEPFTVDDYIYPEMAEAQGGGLMFDQQVALIWDVTDRMTHEQEEHLDTEAQGCGIHEPMYTVRLKADTDKLDLEKITDGLLWPKKLTKIFYQYNEAIIPYERKDRNTNK